MLKRKPVPRRKMSATPTPRAIMPGSFLSDEEFIAQINTEVFHNPWESTDSIVDPVSTLERLQELVASAAENEQPELRWDVVDWRKFDPPAALRRTPNITSHILLDIVQSSINRVRERAKEERRLELMAEEQRLLDELEARKAEQKGKQPYLPIIILEDKPLPEAVPAADSSPSHGHSALCMITTNDRVTFRSSDELSLLSLPTQDTAGVPAPKLQKSRDSAIRRLFKRSNEKGESSAEGSAREGLLQRLMEPKGTGNIKSTDETTNDAVARLKKRLRAVQEPESLLECVSCMEDYAPRDCVRVQCHAYCKDCFVRLISTVCENEAQWPPKCCLNNIPFALVRKNVPTSLKKTFTERSNEWNIPVAERVYCWRTDCSLFIRPEKIKSTTSTGQCDKGHWTCLNCRNASHGQDDCPMDEAMILTNQVAEDEGWRRCYQCRALVEHSAACQHMTCRCGAEFCYVCGLRWRTCQCSMTDLDNVKEQANERREQRRVREEAQSADAEELRLILAQIEAFEREEARQAELLAEQQRKEAQERRERELLERVQAESARIRDITLKFQQLRASLDELHDVQFVLLETAHTEAAKSLAIEKQEFIAQLEAKHKVRREELATNFKAKIAAREHAFAKEYKSRVKMEAQVESQFREQLLGFWGDREEGSRETEAAMLRLQRQMDRRFRQWQDCLNETIKQLRESLEEDITVQEELMWSAEELLKARLQTKKREMEERGIAEKKWVEVVMLEREKMINEMEIEEVEGDADTLSPSNEEGQGV